MKKIILGCAAVLLSLGLLAGCNNEEKDKAVSIKVDTAATVVVGESLELPYTVEPEKAEIEVLNNHEEYVTAVAQEGTLYLEGLSAGSATVTLVGTYKKYTEANVSIAVSVVTKSTVDTEPGEQEPGGTGDTGPGEQVIALSVDATLDLIENGDPATIVPVVTPEEADIEYEIKDVEFTVNDPEPDDDAYVISVTPTEEGYAVTPGAQGTANIVFTASLEAEGYDAVTATTAVTVHESSWEPEPEPEPDPFASYTVKVILTASDGSAFPDPGSDYAVWVASYYDSGDSGTNWGSAHAMTYEGEGVFTYKYEAAPTWTNATYDGGVYAGTAEAINWNHEFGAISIPNPTSESGDVVGEFSIQSSIGDTWEAIFPSGNGTTNFHIVVFEDSSNTESKLSNFHIISGSPNYFDSTDSGSNSATTLTSGTTSYNSQPYVYNATAASAGPTDRTPSWVTMHESADTWTTEVSLGWYMGNIPDTADDTVAVFCFVLNTSSLSDEPWVEGVAASGIEGIENGWVTGVTDIDTFFSSYITGTVSTTPAA